MLRACFIARPVLYVQANWSFYLRGTNKTLYSDERNYFPSLYWKIQVCSMPSLWAHIAFQDGGMVWDRSIGAYKISRGNDLEENRRRPVRTTLMPGVKGESPDASSSICSPKYNAPTRILRILSWDMEDAKLWGCFRLLQPSLKSLRHPTFLMFGYFSLSLSLFLSLLFSPQRSYWIAKRLTFHFTY